MKITDVKVFPVDEDKLKAYATITFENCFIVRDLKVISGNKGYFIAMPSKKRKDGTFRDVAHPLNSETRKMIEDAVLEVYEKEHVSEPVPVSERDDDAAEAEDQATEPEGNTEGGEVEGPSENEAPAGESVDSMETAEEEATTRTAEAETVEEETVVEEAEPDRSEESEDPGKGAEENPTIEPTDDPEKAFGYEE
jgi:stage V sporulation protein G